MIVFFTISNYFIFQKNKNDCAKIKASLQQPVRKKSDDYSNFFPAGIMLGEYLWQIYTIDPTIIKAVNFSSIENLDSPIATANYLLQNMIKHDAVAYLGFKNRLNGYIGEQQVAEILQQHGVDALWASTSNQELWDLKIDDNLINVKTILDVHSIKSVALAHPDITYLIPEDTYQNIGIDNIQPLEDFKYQHVNDIMAHTQDQVDGTLAFDHASIHIPVFSLIKSFNERNKLIKAGGNINSVNKNIAIDFTTKTASNLVMAKVGGVIGAGVGSLVFMPVGGAIIGGTLGAFWGAKKGQEFGKKIKELELQKEKIKLDHLLEKFGIQYFPYIEKIQKQMRQIAKRHDHALNTFEDFFPDNIVKKRWGNKLLKNKNTIFNHELKLVGQQIFATEQSKSSKQIALLDDIKSNQDAKALALLIINHIHLRDFLYVDLTELKRIYTQKERVYLERFKLYPDKYSLKN